MIFDRLAIDLGNSRLKWGWFADDGRLADSGATFVHEQEAWKSCLDQLLRCSQTEVAIASVNPPVAESIDSFLRLRGHRKIRWFRSAADVPVPSRLDEPGRTGADRALAVLGALSLNARTGPGIVVQCGTAITIERVGSDGVWHGGAITIGPSLASRALHVGTAQLPDLSPIVSNDPPLAWGPSTEPALRAGIVWGAVGAVRELIARQTEEFDRPYWIEWTGGDAPMLAKLVPDEAASIEPELVLKGLAAAAFGCPATR